jgi:hypothetical protein
MSINKSSKEKSRLELCKRGYRNLDKRLNEITTDNLVDPSYEDCS